MVHNAFLANFNDINLTLARERKFQMKRCQLWHSSSQVDNLNLKHHRSLDQIA
ncbi:MAG: hypothetical protein AAGE84_03125 [Cyanobacteria bacterium P01_G01_bin.39]